MSHYLKQIEQLVDLQKVDDSIHAVKNELQNAPKELQMLEDNFAAIDGKREKILDKLAHIEEQQRRLNLEINEDGDRIRKSKNKLMQVGNTREYHAMIREMDNMEKLNRSREEGKVALVEELELQNSNLEEIEVDYTALKADLEGKKEGLQERLSAAEARLETLDGERLSSVSDVPKPIFVRYEFIRDRLDHPVIVSVKARICSGCNIAIPPQTFIELQRGKQILSCPNCQRLMYWCEHFHVPVPENIEVEELTD